MTNSRQIIYQRKNHWHPLGKDTAIEPCANHDQPTQGPGKHSVVYLHTPHHNPSSPRDSIKYCVAHWSCPSLFLLCPLLSPSAILLPAVSGVSIKSMKTYWRNGERSVSFARERRTSCQCDRVQLPLGLPLHHRSYGSMFGQTKLAQVNDTIFFSTTIRMSFQFLLNFFGEGNWYLITGILVAYTSSLPVCRLDDTKNIHLFY